MKVLIADDEKKLTTILKSCFERGQFEVFAVKKKETVK